MKTLLHANRVFCFQSAQKLGRGPLPALYAFPHPSPQLVSSWHHFREMSTKRKGPPSKATNAVKRQRVDVPDYHLTPSVHEQDGSVQWPAPKAQIETARNIILSWYFSPPNPERTSFV